MVWIPDEEGRWLFITCDWRHTSSSNSSVNLRTKGSPLSVYPCMRFTSAPPCVSINDKLMSSETRTII